MRNVTSHPARRSALRRHGAALAAFALVLAGLAALAPGASAAAPQAKWTVMVYMSGDNNLEDYIVKDLELELAAPVRTPTSRSSPSPIAAPATTRAAATGRPRSSTT